jgi:hypothetical protein
MTASSHLQTKPAAAEGWLKPKSQKPKGVVAGFEVGLMTLSLPS